MMYARLAFFHLFCLQESHSFWRDAASSCRECVEHRTALLEDMRVQVRLQAVQAQHWLKWLPATNPAHPAWAQLQLSQAALLGQGQQHGQHDTDQFSAAAPPHPSSSCTCGPHSTPRSAPAPYYFPWFRLCTWYASRQVTGPLQQLRWQQERLRRLQESVDHWGQLEVKCRDKVSTSSKQYHAYRSHQGHLQLTMLFQHMLMGVHAKNLLAHCNYIAVLQLDLLTGQKP